MLLYCANCKDLAVVVELLHLFAGKHSESHCLMSGTQKQVDVIHLHCKNKMELPV